MQWPKEKGEMTNNDLQNITQQSKDRATQTLLKHGVNGSDNSTWLNSDTRRALKNATHFMSRVNLSIMIESPRFQHKDDVD